MTRAALSLLAIVVLTACEPTYGLECGGPDRGLAPEECEAVAAHVVAVKPAVAGYQLGDLATVSVELIACSAEEARGRFLREIAEPTADRCWAVTLSYAGGVLGRVAIRQIGSGEVTVH
jgi:hypothetical protein